MRNYNYFFFLIFWVLIASCNTDESLETASVIIHPIEDNIPYIDRDHIEISATESVPDNGFLPDILMHLKNYLKEDKKYEIVPLELHVSRAENVDIAPIDSSRIVVLDKISNGFFLYDLNTHHSTLLAKPGRGPGDIAYPQEMAVFDDEVYVSREDMMISKFICHSENCDYDTTIPLEYSAVSFTKAGSHYAILGQFLHREDSEPEIDRNAVRVIDKEGNAQDTFGLYYETDHHIILFRMRRGGMVRYSESQKNYILAFRYLPIFYVFDEELAIDQTFTFTKYLQGEILYYTELNGSSPPTNDMTTISKMEVIDDKYLLIITTTRYKEDESETGHMYEQDYYALNLESNESQYLGGERNESNTLIYPLINNFIRVEDGELYHLK